MSGEECGCEGCHVRSVGVRGVSCGVWVSGEECGCEGCHVRSVGVRDVNCGVWG